MPGTGISESITTLRPATSAWHNLAWKVLVALLILLLMSAGIPVSSAFVWTWVWATLFVWGGLVVAVAAGNLFNDLGRLRWPWVALAVGAYAALAVPGIAGKDPAKLVDVLAPVAALTLAAHLARRDLPEALRDWALVVGLALYAALGVTSMWLVISTFANNASIVNGLLVFVIVIVLPPLVLEGALLGLRRLGTLRDNLWAQVAAVAASTLVSIILFSVTQLNNTTQLTASLTFGVLAGLLVGGALLVSLLTKPLAEVASGARTGTDVGGKLGHALVELSHGPVLIALALYLPLRLLMGSVG